MPVSTAAGRNVRYTFSPVCNPMPVARITFFSVLCLIIPFLMPLNAQIAGQCLARRMVAQRPTPA